MSITVNGYDLGRLVYHLSEIDGHLAPTVTPRGIITLGNAAGLWSTQVTVTPREVMVGCDVRPDSLADRQAIMDRLARRLGGDLEITTADLPTRFLRGRLSAVEVQLYPGSFAQPACFVTLRFAIPDAARSEVEPLVYGLSTARTSCPVGTATSAPFVYVYGACTNPVVILRGASGAEVGRLTFTVTLGATESLAIDASTQRIDRTTAGVIQTGASSGLAVFTSGVFPILSPEDATPDGTAWPTLELAASSGTPTGLVLYQRRY